MPPWFFRYLFWNPKLNLSMFKVLARTWLKKRNKTERAGGKKTKNWHYRHDKNRKLHISYSPSIQVLVDSLHSGVKFGLTQKQSKCMHFSPWILQRRRALDFAFYCSEGWAKLHNVNVIFNQCDVFWIYCIGTVCLRYDSNTWMVLACLQWVVPASSHKTCKQWRLSHNVNW